MESHDPARIVHEDWIGFLPLVDGMNHRNAMQNTLVALFTLIRDANSDNPPIADICTQKIAALNNYRFAISQ